MRTLTLAVALLFAAACGGDDGGKSVDAPHGAIDSPAGGPCTGATYDPCDASMPSQCTANMCHFYMSSNLTVCTAACSATNPCPNDAAGLPVACNMMGNCKPSVANNCTR
jgi:hypothetical protein